MIVLAIAVFFPSPSSAELTIERAVKKEVERRLINSNLTILPQLNKLTVGFGRTNSKGFYFIKSLSKIFFQDKNVIVKVTDLSFKDDGVIFELWNNVLGGGKIRIFFYQEGSSRLTADDIESAIKFSLSSEKNLKVIVNAKSKIFHLNTSNHFPEINEAAEMSLSEALNKGFKPCGYCFAKLTYLPESNIENQLAAQQAAVLRYTNPLLVDQTMQSYIQEVGNRVIKKWHLPFLGYAYHFQVIEGKDPNASALPGGHIMVTSGLLNAVENEEELEAVLAHEIGHVERRHLLRHYHALLEKQQAQAALEAFGAMAAGMAAASGNKRSAAIASAAAIGVSILGIYAIEVYYSGYPKDYEREADDLAILYFQHNGMNKRNLENVFRKLEFWNLTTQYNPDPKSLTHPYLEERIARVRQGYFRTFDTKSYIYTSPDQPTVQLDLLYRGTTGATSTVGVYLSDYSLLEGGFTDVYLSIGDENGVKRFELESKGIIRDTWGAYLLFKSDKAEVFGNISGVDLSVVSQSSDAMSGTSEYTKSYSFKQGVITY